MTQQDNSAFAAPTKAAWESPELIALDGIRNVANFTAFINDSISSSSS